MTPPEWVEPSHVRHEVHPAIYRVLVELRRRGWRVRRQGHKFYAYCPCEDGGSKVRVDGTPRNPEGQARRLLREAGRCPDRHALDV